MCTYHSKDPSCIRVFLKQLFLNCLQGAFVARGRFILMADSDNATQFSDVEKLEAACAKVERDGLCVGVGSRAHLEETAVAERTVFRNILMWGFHFLVRFVGGIHGIKDTQCGFKIFSRKAAALLFPSQHVERWCFDIELLYLAAHFHIPAVEVAVRWQEIAGSKLDPVGASAQMARDLFRIRLFYLLGFWKIEKLE
jgi:dolichyl-phosphate beta-glucosyltransferase